MVILVPVTMCKQGGTTTKNKAEYTQIIGYVDVSTGTDNARNEAKRGQREVSSERAV